MISLKFYIWKILLLILIFVRVKCNLEREDTIETLDAMLSEIKTQRYSRDTNDDLKIWQKYEFGSGAGNREELVVSNISIDKTLSKEVKNWHYSGGKYFWILSGSENSSLWVYLHSNQDGRVHDSVNLTVSGKILTYKVIILSNQNKNEEDIIAVLCVESVSEIKLLWYKYKSNNFELIWSSLVSKRVERLDFFQYREQNKLVLLNEPMNYNGGVYSSIEIYGFNFVGGLLDFWLCQRIWLPKVSRFEICSIYENIFLNFQSGNVLSLYEFKDSETKEGLLKLSQNITFKGIKNSICFENGYTEYLLSYGPEPALFTYKENEFLYVEEMEKLFNDLGEILWVQCLPVKTYREECLLLIQLKNLTIIGMSWQGENFKVITLPRIEIENFELSKVTAIPKYGFVFGNKLIKVETKLQDLPRPVHDEMTEMLQLKNFLEDTFIKQEIIIDETEKRFKESYYNNPVITGNWNLSEVITNDVIISSNVSYGSLKVGSKVFTENDIKSDLTEFDEQFKELDEKINKIKQLSSFTVRQGEPEVHLKNGFSFDGGIKVLGTLNVKNLTLESLNGFTFEEIFNDFVNYDNNVIIKGTKSFPSIEASVINIEKINGIPREKIIFDTEKKNYENISLNSLKQLIVNGSLNFTDINGYSWENLMKNVVWKNRPTIIPGLTTIHGEVFADAMTTSFLNGIKYPEEYVLENSTNHAEISGEKTFGNLKVMNLKGIKRINGIPYEDFITLNQEQTLPNEITFKNLVIEENLQIDGRITGIEIDWDNHRLTLNDINVITADTAFTDLHVKGNLIVENSVNEKTLHDFEDLLRKTDKTAVITGHKHFIGNVAIDTKLNVASKKYNGHPINEFVTLNGEQEFPNLVKISAPVTFGQFKYKQLNDLENYLKEFSNHENGSKCSNKKLIFNVPPILENVNFLTLNNNISSVDFSKKLAQTLETVTFENLEVENLYADTVTPKIINGVNFNDFENRRISNTKSQILTGNYTINSLKTEELKTKSINGMSLDDLEKFRADFEDLFDRIWNGKMVIDTVIVKDRVMANKINGELISNIYANSGLRNVIVDDGFYAKELIVDGLVNGINLTEYILDSVYKTDRDIVLRGIKTFDTLNCEVLQVSVLNGNPIEDILNPNLPQTLTGPVFVKGNVVVKEFFYSDGKINDIKYKELFDRVTYLGNDTYKLRGNFRFPNNVTIENLQTDGPVQGITFDSFLDTVIFKGDNVDISGTKVFVNSVTFQENLTVVDNFNGIDLTPFNNDAVLIDKDIHIDSEVIFQDDLTLGGNLIVEENLDAKMVSNVDIEELKSSAIFLNRPSYVQGTLTFTNASFESGLTVDYLNGIDLNSVISTKEDQIIFNPLSFVNVNVEKLEITGTINGYDVNELYSNTFTLFGNQSITGNLIFHGNVIIENDFNPLYINGIETSRMVTLNENEKISGTFQFLNPLILRKDLRVFGLINDIDPATWESEAVYDSFPKKQLVSGKWFIKGNVTFEKDVLGNGLLNGINVQRLSDELEKRKLTMESKVTGFEMDIKSTCNDLKSLQSYAKNQIYRFKFFEYFQTLNFDVGIKSAHHFETVDGEFLLINLEGCFLNTFVYNKSGFTRISSKNDFDDVDKWITLKYKDQIYLVTLGNGKCGKSFGNLWKFENQTLTHILNLESINDVKKISDYVFLVIFEERLEKWSIEDVHRGLYGNSTSYLFSNGYIHFIPNTERVLIIENNYIHEFQTEYLNHTSVWNQFGNGTVLCLQAGVYKTEMFLYYDEGVSENNAFIFNGLSNRKIRQSIPTHKPKSFLVINFDGFVETFLTFVKNDRSIEIFEYKGIEGFVYRESIKMQVEKTFGFKLRKRSGLSKINFVGAIHWNTLTILEAKMYGEKLDMEYLNCED